MTRDRIIEKVLNDMSIDPRIPNGIFDIANTQHVGYLCEYLMGKGIESEIVYEFANVLLEKGKFPERQAYNRNGILVTFPTPEYKKEAIKAGTHFEDDPTKGQPNLFQNDKPPATAPPPAAQAAQAGPTKTNLPVSTSTATPPPAEKSGEDAEEPAQPMPNAFTTAAPQQSPTEEPVEEPTELPPPQPVSPREKEANKDVIKKILKGDDYMLEAVVTYIVCNAPHLIEEINKRRYD
jgi:hypothetical protein